MTEDSSTAYLRIDKLLRQNNWDNWKHRICTFAFERYSVDIFAGAACPKIVDPDVTTSNLVALTATLKKKNSALYSTIVNGLSDSILTHIRGVKVGETGKAWQLLNDSFE